MRDKVILVNDADEEIGVEDKMIAHKKGFTPQSFLNSFIQHKRRAPLT